MLEEVALLHRRSCTNDVVVALAIRIREALLYVSHGYKPNKVDVFNIGNVNTKEKKSIRINCMAKLVTVSQLPNKNCLCKQYGNG